MPYCANCNRLHRTVYCPLLHKADIDRIIGHVKLCFPLRRIALRRWIESALTCTEENATDIIDGILDNYRTYDIVERFDCDNLPMIDFA